MTEPTKVTTTLSNLDIFTIFEVPCEFNMKQYLKTICFYCRAIVQVKSLYTKVPLYPAFSATLMFS